MHRPKKILILDDDDELRKILCQLFGDYRFEVLSAATTLEAHDLFNEQVEATAGRPASNPIDVLLLDMRLENESPTTGADFGIAIRQQCEARRLWPPESLIYSAFQEPDFFQKAIKLGAAGYLDKTGSEQEQTKHAVLVRHVRALALRRALRAERPGLTERIRKMASEAKSQHEALDHFCDEILGSELEASLGNRFVLLLTDADGTRAFSSLIPGVCRVGFCDQLQAAIFNDLSSNEPYIVRSSSDLPSESDNELRSILVNHPGTAFLRLFDIGEMRLSLGLIQEDPNEMPWADPAESLATVLASYLSPLLVSHLIQIATTFAEAEAERKREIEIEREKANVERKTLLGSLASFSRHFGQQLLRQLEYMGSVSKNNPVFKPLDSLRELGEELADAAELLDNLKDADAATAGQADAREPLECAVVTSQVVDELVSRGLASPDLLQVKGGCTVRAREENLAGAIYRILLWLARRRMEIPDELQPVIEIRCAGEESDSVIHFEDRSRRLSKPLRQRLFAPFDTALLTPGTDRKDRGRRLGLYLARAMVEAEGGSLEDRSDDLPGGNVGHLFVMSFPLAVRA